MKIVSIDPAMNGVTAILIAEWDEYTKDVELENWMLLDFRFEDKTDMEHKKEAKYQLLNEMINYIVNLKPDLVICENFIMFATQMGQFGQSFITSEMIGVIDWEMRKNEIPMVKPRPSDVRSPVNEFYIGKDGSRKTKPRKFKISNEMLIERGYLARGYRRALEIVIKGNHYKLNDYKIGAKNDHIIMALRHLLNITDNKNIEDLVNERSRRFNIEEVD